MDRFTRDLFSHFVKSFRILGDFESIPLDCDIGEPSTFIDWFGGEPKNKRNDFDRLNVAFACTPSREPLEKVRDTIIHILVDPCSFGLVGLCLVFSDCLVSFGVSSV